MALDVRRIAQAAMVYECPTAATMFSHDIDASRLISGTEFERDNKQSGFAFARGNRFEARLHENDSEKLVDILCHNGIGLAQDCRVINLRSRHKNNSAGIIGRKNDTDKLLQLAGGNKLSNLILVVGPVFQIEVGNKLVSLEADFLVIKSSSEILVGEIKSFPVIDSHVRDARSLGEAQDQMGIYVVAVKQTVRRLGIASVRVISNEGVLITPHNTTQKPHLSRIKLGIRVQQMEERLQRLGNLIIERPFLPESIHLEQISDLSRSSDERVADLAVFTTQVGTHYLPHCHRACALAPYCRHIAHQQHSPTLGGITVQRQLPNVNSMERAIALAQGATPDPLEEAVAQQLQFEARLYAMLTQQNRQENVA